MEGEERATVGRPSRIERSSTPKPFLKENLPFGRRNAERGGRGPFKAQGTEQARELTCARRTNINRKELHNAERTRKKKLLYKQWVGWRVSIRLAITARLRAFTTTFPSFLQESSDELQITLYASVQCGDIWS